MCLEAGVCDRERDDSVYLQYIFVFMVRASATEEVPTGMRGWTLGVSMLSRGSPSIFFAFLDGVRILRSAREGMELTSETAETNLITVRSRKFRQ